MNKTCKDCMHYDVCAKYNKVYERELSHRYCTECKDFKDKSRYIELPCAVGDRVYVCFNTTNDIKEFKIENIVIGEHSDQLKFEGGSVFTIWDKDYDEYFGKLIFLTQEEAEKNLRKEDGKNV